jgi:hypothetical protein
VKVRIRRDDATRTVHVGDSATRSPPWVTKNRSAAPRQPVPPHPCRIIM